MKIRLKKYFSIKQIALVAFLILGLNLFYAESATSKYPYNVLYLFCGFGIIVVVIALSLISD